MNSEKNLRRRRFVALGLAISFSLSQVSTLAVSNDSLPSDLDSAIVSEELEQQFPLALEEEEVVQEEVVLEEVVLEEVVLEEVVLEEETVLPQVEEANVPFSAGASTFSLDTPSVYSLTGVNIADIADQLVTGVTTQVIAPTPVVKDAAGATMVRNSDYTLSYGTLGNGVDGFKLGVNTLTVTGIGLNASGTSTATKDFNVYGDLSKATVTAVADSTVGVAVNSYAYTGSVITPTISSVKIGNTVVDVADLDVVYKNDQSTSVGTYTATITGKDGTFLKNSITYTYKIVAIPVSSLELYVWDADSNGGEYVKGSIADQEFTWTAQTPKVTLGNGDGSTILVPGTDLTLAYSDNTFVGTASVKFTAKTSNYSGSVTQTFNIVPMDSSTVNYYGGTNAVADGLMSLVGEKTYVGTQFTLANFNPTVKTSTGAAPALNGGYTEHLALIPSDAKNGWGAEELADALTNDYAGVDADTKTEMETALANGGLPGDNTYLVIGLGSWENAWGSQVVSVKSSLTAATIELWAEESGLGDGVSRQTKYTTGVWSGIAVEPGEIVVSVAGVELVKDQDFTITYSGAGYYLGYIGALPGTATLTFTGMGSYTGSKTATYTVTALPLSDANILYVEVDDQGDYANTGVEDKAFTGSAIDPSMAELRYYYNGIADLDNNTEFTILGKSIDYGFTPSNNIYVGEATVTIKAKSSVLSGTKIETFNIVAADTNYFTETGASLGTIGNPTYTGTQFTLANFNPVVTTSTGAKPAVNGGYLEYLAVIPDSADTTGNWDLDDLIAALASDYASLADDFSGSEAAIEAEMEAALAKGGLPGTNTYIVIGIENWEGSYNSQEFTITASMAAADIELWAEEAGLGDGVSRQTKYTTGVWSGIAVEPGEIVVSVGDVELVKDQDFTITYSGAGYYLGYIGALPGTVTLTFTGIGEYTGSKTATYTVTALPLSDANILYVEVDDQGDYANTGIEDKGFTGSAINLEEAELRYYYNGIADLDTNTEFTTLVRTVDYGFTPSNNVNVGEATVTLKAKGSMLSGQKVETFNIVAADSNYFTATGASLGAIADQSYVGTQCSLSSINPVVTTSTGAKPAVNGGYVEYMAIIPDSTDTTDNWDLDDLIAALASDYASLADDFSGSEAAIEAEMKAALAKGGLPGVNTYIVIGIENWEGSYNSQEFNITANLSKAKVVFYDNATDYNEVTSYYPDEVDDGAGNVVTPTIKVVYGTKDEVTGLYTCELDDSWYSADFTSVDFTTAGAKKVTVTAVDGAPATSSVVGNFTITGYSFDDENTYLDFTAIDKEYSGFNVGEIPVIKFSLKTWDDHTDDGTLITLTRNVDFTASLENSVDVAAADSENPPTIIVKGIGAYAGSFEINYNIALPTGTDFVIEDVEKQLYTGNFVTPTPSVTAQLAGDPDDTRDLVEGVDFTYSYSSNVHVGVGSATVTINGIGNYAGVSGSTTFSIATDCSASSDFTVALFPEDAADTTGTAVTSFEWTGAQIQPVLLVKDGSTTLVEGDTDDYTVEFGVNTELGTGTVTITPNETVNYFGSKTVSFDITAMDISAAGYEVGETFGTAAEIAEKSFSGNYITVEDLLIFDDAGTEVSDLTYTVDYSDNLTVGTATVSVTGTGNYTGTITNTFDIAATATDLFDDAIIYGITEEKFTGAAVTPAPSNITIENPLGGTLALKEGEDYTIGDKGTDGTGNLVADSDYTDNILPGEATIYIVGINSYAGNAKSMTFDIIADLTEADIYFTNGDLVTGSVTEALTANFDWVDADVAPTIDVIFNYNHATDEHTMTFDATESASMYTIAYDEATEAGDHDITVTPTSNDLGKYYKGTATTTYTINQIDLSNATKATPDSGSADVVTFTDEDLILPYTGKPVVPTLEELTLAYDDANSFTWTLTEDDFTITYTGATDGSDNIGTGLDVVADIKVTITGTGNFTGSFEYAYSIGTADLDELLEGAYLDKVADMVFVGDIVKPASDPKVWGYVDGKLTDISQYFTFYYSTESASGTARVRATGNAGTIYAGGRVDTYCKVIGDLSQAVMTFDTDDILNVQAHFVRADGTFCEIPASAYTVTGISLNASASSITYTISAVTSQFYKGTLTGTNTFGLSMNNRDTAMPADTSGGGADGLSPDGILTEAEFNAAITAYKAKSGYEQDAAWGTDSNQYSTYQNGVVRSTTECASFVFQLADAIFGAGSAPASVADPSAGSVAYGEYDHYVVSMDQLRVGDYAYTGSHWVLIIAINNGTYTLAEGNITFDPAVGGVVSYTREVGADYFPAETTTFYSRYPYAG